MFPLILQFVIVLFVAPNPKVALPIKRMAAVAAELVGDIQEMVKSFWMGPPIISPLIIKLSTPSNSKTPLPVATSPEIVAVAVGRNTIDV